ncbi:MAG TPA: DUF459 domain-containing protein, partial [Acidimicrobiia bacterium]
VSHFLHTDRPREWIQNTLDRAGDDDIETALPSPTTLPVGEAATTTTIQTAFSPTEPMRMWVGGDSLAIVPGQSVLESFPGTSEGAISMVRPDVDGWVSTGLARPEVLNWPLHLQEQTAALDPDVVVLTLGSNDDQALTGAPGGATISQGDAEQWVDEYRRRVGGLMDQIIAEGRTLVLVGVPIVRDGGRSAEYNTINTIFMEEAAKRDDRVIFVDTWELFQDENGNYADYLPNEAGEAVKYRADDGIHLTGAGGDVVAKQIYRQLSDQFDLTSWKTTTTTASTAATGVP